MDTFTGNLKKNLIKALDSPFGVIVLVVTLFFLQTPYFFAVIPVVNGAAFYVRWILVILLGLCVLILNGSLKALFRNELLLFVCVLWNIILCISMKLNGKSVSEVTREIIPTAILAVLVISVFSRVNVRKFLFVLFIYSLVINTLNNVSVMLFVNNGIWIGPFGARDPEYIFFGHINEGLTCGVNSILFGCFYSRQYGREWDIVNVVNLVFSLITAFAVECDVQIATYAASLFALAVCYAAARFTWMYKVMKWISLKTIMIFNMIVFVAVVLLGNTGWMEKIGFSSDMHYRRPLWNAILGSIRQRPVMGLGYTSWINAMMNYGAEKTFWHQHSIYLMVLYETGIVGFLVFAVLFVLAIRSAGQLEKPDLRFLVGVIVGVFFLSMVIEVCQRSEILLLLAACWYIPRMLKPQDAPVRGR